MKRLIKMLSKRFLVILFVIFALFIIATGNKKEKIISYNTNNVKSVQAIHIVNKYNSLVKEHAPKVVDNFYDVIKIAPKEPVVFSGMMTSYGPDCPGCSGKSGCPPRQDLRNGNIYFNDNTYGTVRIVATDSAIPCGTIVKISGSSFNEPIYAVALDRGSAIAQNKMDLLYESNNVAAQAGTYYNISFEIVRWGW